MNTKTNHLEGLVQCIKSVMINILEATFADFRMGMKNNAFAGWTLSKYKCGEKQLNAVTGAGPSRFSDDGQMVERIYPYGKEWSDLYQSWNMAFCTRFKDFVYVIPKLLIPEVANYAHNPGQYVYVRAIALYIYLNWSAIDYVENKKANKPLIEWHDHMLSKEFGKANAQMAKRYIAKFN